MYNIDSFYEYGNEKTNINVKGHFCFYRVTFRSSINCLYMVTGQNVPTTKTPPLFTKTPHFISKINHYKQIFYEIQMFINVFPR
jgi:hypothetical protein